MAGGRPGPGRRRRGAAAAAAGAGPAGGARARPAAGPAAGICGGAAGAGLRRLPARPGGDARLLPVSPGWRPSPPPAPSTRPAACRDDPGGACGGARPGRAAGPLPLVRPRHRGAPGRGAAVLDARRQPVGQGGDRRLAGLDRARPGSGAPIRLWPFEGGLHALLAPGVAVLAEVYPAEALRHCGLRLAGSKRAQGPRRRWRRRCWRRWRRARSARTRRWPPPSRPASAPMRPARTASIRSSACSA